MSGKTFQVVRGGVVVDAIVADADALVVEGGRRLEWAGDGIGAPDGCTFADVDGAAIGWTVDGAALVPPYEPPITPEAIIASKLATITAERDRRIAAGLVFKGVAFQSDAVSLARIDKSRGSAMAAIMGGAQPGDLRWHGLPVDFIWIAADNSRLPMDAPTMVAFGNAVAAREGLLIVTANDLKLLVEAGETIADIADDALWPA